MDTKQIERFYKSALAGLIGAGLGYWIGTGLKVTILDIFIPITYLAGQNISRAEAGMTGAIITGALAAYAVYDKWLD